MFASTGTSLSAGEEVKGSEKEREYRVVKGDGSVTSGDPGEVGEEGPDGPRAAEAAIGSRCLNTDTQAATLSTVCAQLHDR